MKAKQYASESATDHWRNQKDIKICIEINNKNTTTQNLWDSVLSSAKREAHSNTSLLQETRETSNKQPKNTPKTTRKDELKNLSK